MSKLTLDEAIKHCLETVEQLEERANTPYKCEDSELQDNACRECAAEHRQLAEWLTELKEAKRLLKLAVEDVHELLCDRDDVSRGKGQACRTCSHIMHCSCCEQCTVKEELRHWRYADEALKLIES